MPEPKPSTEALIAEIKTAFDGSKMPADDELLHPDCRDDVDILEFYGGIKWQDMTDEMVVYAYAAPTAFSAKAFQYYLPAYLAWTLRNPDSPEYAGESILLALDPGTPDEGLHDFRKSKFAMLTLEQRDVIRKILCHLTNHANLGELAETALLNCWLDDEA